MTKIPEIMVKKHSAFSAFTGAAALPVNTMIMDRMTPFAQPQYILNPAHFPPEVQNLIDFARSMSLDHSKMPFREVSVIAYSDKDERLHWNWNTLDMPDVTLLPDRSALLAQIDEGDIPEYIIDIHTHPCPQYRTRSMGKGGHILMSTGDFKGYRELASNLMIYAEQEIPILALVCPVGQESEEVIATWITPFDEDHSIKRKSGYQKFKDILRKALTPPAPEVYAFMREDTSIRLDV